MAPNCDDVKSYVIAVREAGGVITTSITIAAATAIVRQADRNLLFENGDSITLTTNWAKSLLYRLNFVKRRGSSTAKVSVQNFEELKEQFIADIKAVVDMEDIPRELIFNWDHTGISIVPGSSWTMESKRVEIVGINNKRLQLCFVVQQKVILYRFSLFIRERPKPAYPLTNFMRKCC